MDKEKLIEILNSRIHECTLLRNHWLTTQHQLNTPESIQQAGYWAGRIDADMKALSDIKRLEEK